jgi:tRNA-dihydrouridine synthase
MMKDKSLIPQISLGPFQGITDHIYRTLFVAYFGGVDKLYTPFFTAIHKTDAKNLQGAELHPDKNDTSILVPQILSNDGAEMLRFANFCARIGYKEINLNMGCPFPRVARKKRGSGLLPFPDLIDKILFEYFENPPIKLSIKCRLGYQESNEINELIPIFNQYPLHEVIIHARTGKQIYKGIANQVAFITIKNQFSKVPAYNGDIFSNEQFNHLQALMPNVDHFMLGRGLLADPFLAAEIKGQTFINKAAILREFLEALFEARLNETNYALTSLGRMKELWSYLRWSFDDPVNIWRLIRKTNTLETYKNAVSKVFAESEWKGAGFTQKSNPDYIS